MSIINFTNDPNLSRKERERQFKRKEILSAACRIFADKGFDAATLDEIAEASEYGKGTLYNYFQNKEDIYIALLESILIEYITVHERISENSKNFYDYLMNMTVEIFNYSISDENTFLLLMRMRRIPGGDLLFKNSEKVLDYLKKINTINSKYVNEAIASEQIRNIDVESFLVLYRNMTFSYIYNLKYCKNQENIDVHKEASLLIDIIFNGIKNNS